MPITPPKKIDPRILALIPEDVLQKAATEYCYRKLKNPTRRTNILSIFTGLGISRHTYDMVIGLLGSVKELHNFLGKSISLQEDRIAGLLTQTIDELSKRMPNMSDEVLLKLASALLELAGNAPAAANSAVNVNFDINEYLSKRVSPPMPKLRNQTDIDLDEVDDSN